MLTLEVPMKTYQKHQNADANERRAEWLSDVTKFLDSWRLGEGRVEAEELSYSDADRGE